MPRTFLLLALLALAACGEDPKPDDTGAPPEDTGPFDHDEDGWTGAGGDCDDADPAIHPEAEEVCDGLDQDCDEAIDEGLEVTWYADADADGYGDPATTAEACAAPEGYLEDSTDCDDADATIHPGAEEVCDDLDQDCDGDVDEGLDATWYADADGDGFGDEAAPTVACACPTGYVADATDCDDAAAAVYPRATETCNDLDDDCDGLVDDEDTRVSGQTTWYADGDLDGYGVPGSALTACEQPTGYITTSGDCDDADPEIHPGVTEVCDGVDQDCDGTADDSAIDALTWYRDLDGDGYGDPATTSTACTAPTGYTSDASDCDDLRPTVHPGATETCDRADQDCDGLIDEDAGSTWYLDGDGDGYGDPTTATRSCTTLSGYVTRGTDCDDTSSSVYPGATEHCDGVDDDCDGTVDSPAAAEAVTWYYDADGDGYGDDSTATVACEAGSDWVEDGGDCDDTNDVVHPGAEEIPDGIDDDCDGIADAEACDDGIDNDGDGDTDCDDDDCDASTDCHELGVCDDGADNDGDGLVDCEDGDCATDPSCSEADACTDGADNDSDGLTDCDDDECWATCADAPYRARVLDGHAHLVMQRRDVDMNIGSVHSSHAAQATNWASAGTGWATSVTGTLSVVPSAYWTGAPIATCQWSLASASMHRSSSGRNGLGLGYALDLVARDGFTIEPGCGWSTSGFLPARLGPQGAVVRYLGSWSAGAWGRMSTTWYGGSITSSTGTTAHTIRHLGYPSTATMWQTVERTTVIRSYEVDLGLGDDYPGAYWAHQRWSY
ncbi:MAG: putative metal-binding motif-containing protein [Pseudomonadota bacterium]